MDLVDKVETIGAEALAEGRLTVVTQENAIDVLLEDLEMGEKSWTTMKPKITAWRDFFHPEIVGEAQPEDGEEADDEEELSKINIHDVAKTTRWIVANLKEVFMKDNLVKLSPHLVDNTTVIGYDQKIVNRILDRVINKEKFLSEFGTVWVKDGTAVVRVGWNSDIDYVDVEEFDSMSEQDFLQKSQEKILLEGGEMIGIGVRGYCKFGVKVINEDSFDLKTVHLDDARFDPRIYVKESERFYFLRYDSTIADLIKNDKERDQRGQFSGVADLIMKEYPNFLKGKSEDSVTSTDLTLEEYGMDGDAIPVDFYRHPIELYEGWDWVVDSEEGVSRPYHFIFSKDHQVVLLMEKNDLPDDLPPLIPLPFGTVPFTNYGDGIAEYMGDYQANRKSLLRLMMNSAMLQTDNVKIIEADVFDKVNMETLARNAAGSICVTKQPLPKPLSDTIMQLNPSPLNPMYFQLWQMLGGLAEDESGMLKYAQGEGYGDATSTASGISMIMNKAQKRLAEMIYRLQFSLFYPLVKKIVLYAAAYMQPETFAVICGKEADYALFKNQNKDMFDVNMSINFSGQDDFKINQYIQLLGVIKPFQDGGQVGGYFTNIILADIFEIRGKEDFADEFRKMALASVQEERMQKQMQAMAMQEELGNKKKEMELKERDVAMREEKTKGELAKIASEMASPVSELTNKGGVL